MRLNQKSISETARVFLAVELPPKVKGALADLVEQLGRAHVPGLRLVRPEGIHLTLKFLGDVSKDQVEPIVEAVSQMVKEDTPFTLSLGALGVFPERNAPRVLWVGIEGDLASLKVLHREVENSLAALGFEMDKRGFSPHLTVARIRDRTSARDREKASETLLSARIDSGLHIEVGSVSLIQSTLLPDGARYARIASAPLGHGSGEQSDR